MDKQKIEKLREQILKVIPLLEQKYDQMQEPKVNLFLKRYRESLEIIQTLNLEEITKEYFTNLEGCSRSYMEVSSNYDQPFLYEMGETEQLLINL